MKTSNRFIFQILLWLGFWILLWIGERSEPAFINNYSLIFFFQICLIGGITYFVAPQLLFKNQQVIFSVLVITVILIFAFLSTDLFNNTPPLPHNMPPVDKGHGSPPKPIVINFLFLSIASLTTIFIENNLFIQKKEKEVILNKNVMLQTELKLLKSQINPHFLFNTLNNIYTLSIIDSDKTPQSIAYLSTMLRYVLYDCEEEFVYIQQEIEYIENYIKLFSLKSAEPYPIVMESDINNSSTKIASMILIPFLENALKHSYIETSFIKIKIVENEDGICFEIENSISNISVEKDEVGGIGLENVRKRLAILYPEKHKLQIKASDSIFKINLTINSNEKT